MGVVFLKKHGACGSPESPAARLVSCLPSRAPQKGRMFCSGYFFSWETSAAPHSIVQGEWAKTERGC